MKEFAVRNKKGIFVIIAIVLFVSAVAMLCLVAGADAPQANADSSDVIDYGFMFNGAVVTSKNCSGEGWSYNPTTQVFTLGEEGKSYTFNAYPKHIYGDNKMHAIDGKLVIYSSLIQPTCETWSYQDWTQTQTIKETLSVLPNENRPQKLKIVVKGDVQLGDSSWSGQPDYQH